VLTLLVTLAGVASAQTPRALAKVHFDQGEAYFKAGTYDKAAEEYQAAYDLVPEPGLLFNIGLAFENFGDATRATAAYLRYLEVAPDGVKALEARARLEALNRWLDEAAEAEQREAEARARRDDAARLAVSGDHAGAIAALRDAEALSTDPEIVFDLAIAHRRAGEDTAARAELVRYLEAAPRGPHRGEAIRELDAIDRPTREPRPSLVPAWISLGVGATLGAVGLVFQRRASLLHDELAAELADGTPPLDARDPRIDRGARDRTIGQVTLLAGAVGLAVGAVLAARSLLADRPIRRVSVTPVGGGAAVLVGGEW